MIRRTFLRRMAFAALATWFVDLPLPKRLVPDRPWTYVELENASGYRSTVSMDPLHPDYERHEAALAEALGPEPFDRTFTVDRVEGGTPTDRMVGSRVVELW